jgi:drug/metabolite transporter (DMT)-like permease
LSAPPISRWLGIALLLVIATVLGANHLTARVAFEHGANVTTGVAFRSTGTALFLLLLLRFQGIPLRLAQQPLIKTTIIGLLLAVQSYCLYSAIALIPVALALLAFNTYPMIFVLISWFAGTERPDRRALVAMPVALAGLALALDVLGKGGDMAGRWREIGAGVLWAVAAAFSFGTVLFLNARWLKDVDGRLRTFLSMCVISAVVLVYGAATDDFRLATDATGWAALVLLTVFYGSGITALFVVLPRLGAANNTVALNFEPIAVLGLAWVILDQKVSAVQILGAFIVVGAIAWLGLKKR